MLNVVREIQITEHCYKCDVSCECHLALISKGQKTLHDMKALSKVRFIEGKMTSASDMKEKTVLFLYFQTKTSCTVMLVT